MVVNEPGSIYRLSSDNFTRVEKLSGQGYRVFYPDGRVGEFGIDSNSHAQRSREVIRSNGDPETYSFNRWSIKSMRDTFGNIINYTYSDANGTDGAHYPTRIEYGGNIKITFHYDVRTDLERDPTSQGELVYLHTIRISVGAKTVREYRLFGPKLRRIQEVGFNKHGQLEAGLPPLVMERTAMRAEESDLILTDGLGATTHFELTFNRLVKLDLWGEKFQSHPVAPYGGYSTFPNPNVQDVHRAVVSAVHKSNGIGGLRTIRYAYDTPKANASKFFGFGTIRRMDEQTGIVTYTLRNFEYPQYFGKIAAIYKYTAKLTEPRELIEVQRFVYDKEDFIHDTYYSQGIVGTSHVYLKKKTVLHYEDGQLLGATQTTRTPSYDGSTKLLTSDLVETITGNQVTINSVTSHGNDSISGYHSYGDYSFGNTDITIGDVIHTKRKHTSYSNYTTDGYWQIGFRTRVSTDSYNGSIAAATDHKHVSVYAERHQNTLATRYQQHFEGNSELVLNKYYVYDSYGNIIRTTTNGAEITSRSETITQYLYNKYPQRFSNAKNHLNTVYSYDLRFGTAIGTRDPNDLTTSTERDAFGRVISSTDTNGVTTTISYQRCADIACPQVYFVTPAYRVVTDSPITPEQIEYYDKLGRLIRTDVESFSGHRVYTDTYYNARGLVSDQTQPYLSNLTPHYTTYSYDALTGRLVQTVQPDGGVITRDYNASAADSTRIVDITNSIKDADGNIVATEVTQRKTNLLGQVTEVIEAHNTNNAVTSNYSFDAHGNTSRITVDAGDDGTSTTTYEYDEAGNQTYQNDPSSGITITTYNALNQVRTITDNKNQVISQIYDSLDRPYSRTDIDGETVWIWDTALNGIGKIHEIIKEQANNDSITHTYSYYSSSQLASEVIAIAVPGQATQTYRHTFDYDAYGRLKTQGHYDRWQTAIGFELETLYNERGYVRGFENTSLGVYHKIHSRNHYGRVTHESYSNNVNTHTSYYTISGRTRDIDTTYNAARIQDVNYQWRSDGSMQSRSTGVLDGVIKETFDYDNLNRLTEVYSTLNGAFTRSQDYDHDLLGNLIEKTSTESQDVQLNVTGHTGPYALRTATVNGQTHTLSYDANGAATHYAVSGGDDKFIEYNAFNQPRTIVVGTSLTDPNPVAKDEFRYDADGQRYYKKSTYNDDGVLRVEHTFYVGGFERTIRDNPSDGITQIDKVTMGNIVWLKTNSMANAEYRYLHRDVLGSVEAITDQNGTMIEHMAYEPFGMRKHPQQARNNTTGEIDSLLAQPEHAPAIGFTGHEQLDRTGFVHMNGRLYDPVLGRFVSPDPVVKWPLRSQNWNRYSYVLNNPMKYTDPSGYMQCGPDTDICVRAPRYPKRKDRLDDRVNLEADNYLMALLDGYSSDISADHDGGDYIDYSYEEMIDQQQQDQADAVAEAAVNSVGHKRSNGGTTSGNNQEQQWSHSECQGRCHGVPGLGNRQFLPEDVQKELSLTLSTGLITIPITGGLGTLATSGKVIQVSVAMKNAANTAQVATVTRAAALANEAKATAILASGAVATHTGAINEVIDAGSVLLDGSTPPTTTSGRGMLALKIFLEAIQNQE